MPRLPGPGDLPQARLTPDPGVQAPDLGASGRALSDVGAAMSETGRDIGSAALRQQNRRDAIEFSRDTGAFTNDVTTELERVNSEEDLSLDQVQQGFGTFMSAKREEILQAHKGTRRSRDALEARLTGIEASFVGTAAATATSISRGMINNAVETSLGPLAARVREDPSKANIDTLYGELDTVLSDLSAGFDNPSQEQARRAAGRERIALNAVETLLNRGSVEEALELLDDGGLAKEITDSAASTIRQRAAGIARARDDALRTIAQAEAIAGRPLTPEERLSVIGISQQQSAAEELVEIGDPSSPTGSRLVPRSEAVGQPGRPRQQPLSIGSIPAGHQLVRDPSDPNVMRLEAIPGGPADIGAQDRTNAEVEQKRLTARKSRIVVRDIDKSLAILKKSRGLAAGPIAGTVDFPGTPSFDLQIQLDAVKANVGFDQLQAMRAASPTGGALGAVSERENVLLQSVLGSLDNRQQDDVLAENLNQIREIYLDAWFGTPVEIEQAVEDGRLTEEAAASLQKQRETVGFDAIGRALDPEGEAVSAIGDEADDKATPPDTQGAPTEQPPAAPVRQMPPQEQAALEPVDILAMSIIEMAALNTATLTDGQQNAMGKRLDELGFQ